MEYVTRQFEVKDIKQESDFFSFDGMASTFGNIDLDGDVIMAGAFSESIKQNPNVPILWQHDRYEPIGKSINLHETQENLVISARMPKDDTFVSGRVMPQLRIGSVNKLSIGFLMSENDFEYNRDRDIRVINKASLMEVSIVTFPANPKAEITSVKSIPKFQSIKDIEKFLRSECNMSRKCSEVFISESKRILGIQSDPEAVDKKNQGDPELKEALSHFELLNAIKEIK